MASTDPVVARSPARATTRAPSRVRRRRYWLVLAWTGLLLTAGFLAVEGWALWQERSARQAMADEHLDESQKLIDRALLVRESFASTHLLAARIDRLRGAFPDAERHLSRCEQLGGMSDQLQLEWLLLRCQQGEVDELAPGLLAAVDHNHPDSVAILEALAAVYMRQLRYLEALHCLDSWVERAPDSVRALDWRSWVSNQLDHRAQTISDCERVLELQPARSAVRLRLAQTLVESSRPGDAVPHLERLRQEQPTNPEVLTALARCWMAQARPDDARKLFDAVLASHPDDFDALLWRGNLERENGAFSDAERFLRKALEGSPRDPEARYALYLSLQAQSGRQAEADKELAQWQQDQQARDRLTHLLRTELAAKPNDPDLAVEAAKLLLQAGEDQLGLFWLNRALSIDPPNVAARQELIAYYERTNNPAKAKELRQQLSEMRK
jgi:tetratricopeptide (TPR) repeat protein